MQEVLTELNDELGDSDSEEKQETQHCNVLTGKDFKKLTKKAQKLGAESLDYSFRNNNKYMVTLPDGKKVHSGLKQYPDYLIHEDSARKERYLARAKKIENRKGELTYKKPESANYWSVRLLWEGQRERKSVWQGFQ